jgi:hypothetical protein
VGPIIVLTTDLINYQLELRGGCLFRVKSVGLTAGRPLPIYPAERTSSDRSRMSVRCHLRTDAAQQTNTIRSPRQPWPAAKAEQ